jgi:hypothetical protein
MWEVVPSSIFMSEEEIRQLIASNARAIQAMLEQRETDKLLHEEQMSEMRNNILRLARVEEGLANMLSSIDEDRPAVLRRLMSIENKVDRMLEKDSGRG